MSGLGALGFESGYFGGHVAQDLRNRGLFFLRRTRQLAVLYGFSNETRDSICFVVFLSFL